MFKFIGGVVCGGLIMAVIGSNYPHETKTTLKSGAEGIGSALSAGVSGEWLASDAGADAKKN